MDKQSSGGGLSGSRLNNEYYASGGRGLNERASSSESGAAYNDGPNKMGNHASQMHMARNDSDFNV